MTEIVTEISENELILRARAGAADAFTVLVRRHYRQVHNYLARAVPATDVVDDLTQEVFLRAFRDLETYDGRAAWICWLMGIARHQLLNYLRGEVRRRKLGCESHFAVERLNAVEEIDPVAIADEVQALNECLKQLPPRGQKLVKEHYLLNHSLADIADDWGKKPGAVRMSLLRIRRGLRRCIQKRLAQGEEHGNS